MPRSGTGRVYKRGETWWIQYGFRGQDYRESSKSTKKADATALLRQRLAEMASGKVMGPQEERVMFQDLMDLVLTDYRKKRRKSLRRLELSIKHLQGYFGDLPALAITTERVNAYILARRDAGASDSTVQKELAALKRGFKLAVSGRVLTTQPYIEVPEPKNVRKGFFTRGDVESLAKELPEYLRPVLWFGFLTGWRKGEVLSLQWNQVDLQAGEIRLDPGTTKNDEGRTIPYGVHPDLKALIQEQRERTRTVEKETGTVILWVFHRDGREIRHIDGAWRSACKRAGLTGWMFHDLRRSAVREMERAGVSRSVAMSFTGHKTEAVYRRYAIVDPKVQQEGMERLARHHAGEQEERTVIPMRGAAEG